MTTAEYATRISVDVQKQGYAVWPGFLDGPTTEQLQEQATRLARGVHANHYPKSTRVWDLFRHGEAFVDLLADPPLKVVLDELLGEHHLVSDFSLNVVHPGQPVDGWHIDYPYNEMPTLVSGSLLGLQCVLALSPFHSTNGATELVPGSHTMNSPPEPKRISDQVVFDAKPGSLLIMAAATWHRSGFNASSHPRSAALLSFVERWVRPMGDPPESGPWGRTQVLRTLLGMQRPPETINGVPI
ncbi:phytanoyl-CoA dioxygenase family protein [Streptomyces boncukensis]|uniref:Phytanoyl-CoA dioxygenase family protein n=1 Tax=Streptomyces boncukensis TaxID=2711219 RepID=A0A6G4WP31_9ACTN|nr:phytanoyl-CoA dioxygenase family protein [Streptomyces boncukensis]NGO67019.1 phytanoyl-CoA dioxygenase family protein [Streptomyces boncukensis]